MKAFLKEFGVTFASGLIAAPAAVTAFTVSHRYSDNEYMHMSAAVIAAVLVYGLCLSILDRRWNS